MCYVSPRSGAAKINKKKKRKKKKILFQESHISFTNECSQGMIGLSSAISHAPSS